MDPMNHGQSVGSYVAGSGGPLSAPIAPTSDEKTMGLLAHIGALAITVVTGGWFGWAVPLFLLIAKKDSAYIRYHAVESLNFQITLGIVAAISWALIFSIVGMCVGIPLICAAGVAGIVLTIVAGLKANEGQYYRYPFTLRLVK